MTGSGCGGAFFQEGGWELRSGGVLRGGIGFGSCVGCCREGVLCWFGICGGERESECTFARPREPLELE